MTTTPTNTVDNGVNMAAVLDARDALTAAPDAARFQWRARCEWVNGTHSRTTVHDFSGLGGEHTHRQQFAFEGDHPELFAAEDNGATPVEAVLAALAGCLTAGIASVATNRGVRLRSVTAQLQDRVLDFINVRPRISRTSPASLTERGMVCIDRSSIVIWVQGSRDMASWIFPVDIDRLYSEYAETASASG